MDLATAHTWSFERLAHEYPNRVTIYLAEGIKLPERQSVDLGGGEKLGPYFPVRVLPESRCIAVMFESVLSYQAVDESFAAPQSSAPFSVLSGPVRQCQELEYLRYLENDSLISKLHEGDYQSFLVVTEDQTFFFIAERPPNIELLDAEPNLLIERYETFAAT